MALETGPMWLGQSCHEDLVEEAVGQCRLGAPTHRGQAPSAQLAGPSCSCAPSYSSRPVLGCASATPPGPGQPGDRSALEHGDRRAAGATWPLLHTSSAPGGGAGSNPYLPHWGRARAQTTQGLPCPLHYGSQLGVHGPTLSHCCDRRSGHCGFGLQ